MDKEYIIQLLQRYFTNQATHTEREALFGEVEKHKNNEEWVELLATLRPQVEEIKEYNPEHYQSVINTILATSQQRPDGKTKKGPRVIRMWKWVAAACVLALIGIATYVILSGVEGRHKEPPVATTHDVAAPKETRAVITLANGSKVYLDSVDNGTIAQESNVNVVKTEDGRIIYNHKDTKTQSELVYNTAYNPRGSRVLPLTLVDGTKVWLNAESSLKYPAAFTGNTREVEITGEAYFEVRHNTQQPFKVHLPNGSVVEDIGTSFNINAYPDEADIKATLIEGSVNVKRESSIVNLRPGQQAIIANSIKVNKDVDVEEVMAWKNGLFQFDNANIEMVMRQVARWYDVDVVYESRPTKIFRGGLPRDLSAMKVFKLLEETGGVHFKIEGRKVVVMQ